MSKALRHDGVASILDSLRNTHAPKPEHRPPPASMLPSWTVGELSFPCSNCHVPASQHCTVHVIPCCPGKCPA